MDITEVCKSSENGQYKLTIEWEHNGGNDWMYSGKPFCIAVWLVHHVTVPILFNKMIRSGKRCYGETENMIKRSLVSVDDDIEIDSDFVKLELKCPVSFFD